MEAFLFHITWLKYYFEIMQNKNVDSTQTYCLRVIEAWKFNLHRCTSDRLLATWLFRLHWSKQRLFRCGFTYFYWIWFCKYVKNKLFGSNNCNKVRCIIWWNKVSRNCSTISYSGKIHLFIHYSLLYIFMKFYMVNCLTQYEKMILGMT